MVLTVVLGHLKHIMTCTKQKHLNNYKQVRTAPECKTIVHQWGVKYLELVLLPPFDVVCCHMINPMHCVFLWLAKHTIRTWKDVGVL